VPCNSFLHWFCVYSNKLGHATVITMQLYLTEKVTVSLHDACSRVYKLLNISLPDGF